MVDEDNNQGIEEDILDKPGASARETESCLLRSKVILQDCETCRVKLSMIIWRQNLNWSSSYMNYNI